MIPGGGPPASREQNVLAPAGISADQWGVLHGAALTMPAKAPINGWYGT